MAQAHNVTLHVPGLDADQAGQLDAELDDAKVTFEDLGATVTSTRVETTIRAAKPATAGARAATAVSDALRRIGILTWVPTWSVG